MSDLIERKEVSQVQPGVDPNGLPTILRQTEIFTFNTTPGGTRLLYTAETWVLIRMRLDSAGPVDVGTKEQIDPVLSGKGISLDEEDWTEFTLTKGNRLYYAAGTVNRVKVIIEPTPWSEIIQLLNRGFGQQQQLAQGVGGSILRGILRAFAGGASGQPKPKQPQQQIPCPPGYYKP
jgi:hypothetical protein